MPAQDAKAVVTYKKMCVTYVYVHANHVEPSNKDDTKVVKIIESPAEPL